MLRKASGVLVAICLLWSTQASATTNAPAGAIWVKNPNGGCGVVLQVTDSHGNKWYCRWMDNTTGCSQVREFNSGATPANISLATMAQQVTSIVSMWNNPTANGDAALPDFTGTTAANCG